MQPTNCSNPFQNISCCSKQWCVWPLNKNKSLPPIVSAIIAITLLSAFYLALAYHIQAFGILHTLAGKIGPVTIYATLTLTILASLANFFFATPKAEGKKGQSDESQREKQPKSSDHTIPDSEVEKEKDPSKELSPQSESRSGPASDAAQKIWALGSDFEVEEDLEKGWKLISSEKHIYTPEQVKTLISVEHFNFIEKIGDQIASENRKQYITYEIPALQMGKYFTLVFCHPIQSILPFSSGEKRIYYFEDKAIFEKVISDSLIDYEMWTPPKTDGFAL